MEYKLYVHQLFKFQMEKKSSTFTKEQTTSAACICMVHLTKAGSENEMIR